MCVGFKGPTLIELYKNESHSALPTQLFIVRVTVCNS
jgi:hypothetical protein